MNVIFTGTTGVRKRRVMEALRACRASALASAYPEIRDVPSNDARVRQYIEFADVDEYWGEPVEAVLADGEISQIRRDWAEAFGHAATAVGGARTDRFLAIHATYFWNCRPSIPVSLSPMAEFQPHAFVSLIDDCYAVWWRVKVRDESARRGAYLRLQDVLRWRQFDLWVSQQLVNDLSSLRPNDPPIPHYVLAVKHPAETLYKLLFEPTRLCIYGAHPITDVRRTPECMEEISVTYQGPLREEFVLIEPTTVDEKPLEFAFQAEFSPKEEKSSRQDLSLSALQTSSVALPASSRLSLSDPMVSDDTDMFPQGELKLNAAELFQVSGLRDKQGKTEIDLQIGERDFWLIRMSHRVTGYRPYWSGICPYGAQGVIEELNLGARLHKMPRYVAGGPSGQPDHPALNASPLHDKVKSIDSMNELLEAVRYDQQELQAKVQ